MASLDVLGNDVKYIRQSVDELKIQATRTNGRIGKLEEDKISRDAQLRVYRRIASACIGITVSVLVSVFATFIIYKLKIG